MLFVFLALAASGVISIRAQRSPAPDFALYDTDDEMLSLSDYRGQIVVLDFMATWCDPCRIELNHLKELYSKYGEEIVIISISIDPYYDTKERLQRFIREFSVRWTVARDTANVAIDYAITRIPTIVIIDKEGYVQYRREGVVDESQLSWEIAGLLGEEPTDQVWNRPISTTVLVGASAFSFTAGVFSLLSPCGFPLLPAFISHLIGSKASVRRAFATGIFSTLGLLTTLSVFGIIASTLGSLVVRYISWIQLLVAFGIILLGAVTVVGFPLPSLVIPSRFMNAKGSLGMYAFGVAYGLGVSGCSAPIFFSILMYSATIGIVNGTAMLVLYALGMGAVFIAVSVLTAGAKDFILKKMSNTTPKMHKLSGLALIVFGICLLYLNRAG